MKARIILMLSFISICLSLQALPRIKHVIIDVEAPVEYVVDDNVTGEKNAYWVITARLTNVTKDDRNVPLAVTLQSDFKRLDQEYELIYCESHKKIQQMVEAKNKSKYIDYIDMGKKTFRRGEVRDVIFIFKRPSRYSNNLTLFVEGLSDVTVRKEDKGGLEKSNEDFFTIAKPRIVKKKIAKGKIKEERRFKKLEKKDFEECDGKKFKEHLIYRRSFSRKGDEFHVHEDEIKKTKNEMNQWILMLSDVLPGFPEDSVGQ